MPALSARCASSVAYSPATEMSATLGSSSRRRAETSERGGSRSALPRPRRGGGAAAGELLLGGLQGLLGDLLAVGVDRDDEIRRAGARHLDAARLERLEVGRRAHAHLAAVDAVAAAQPAGDAHELDAVRVAVGDDLHMPAHSSAASCSASIQVPSSPRIAASSDAGSVMIAARPPPVAKRCGGLDLRAHAAGRKLAGVQPPLRLGRAHAKQRALPARAEVLDDARDRGQQHEDVEAERDAELGRGAVLVDDRRHARERAAARADGDAAAAAGDDDLAALGEHLDRLELEDLDGLGAGHHAAPAAPGVLADDPAALAGEPLGVLLAVERADRLGRVVERRIVVVDADAGQDRRGLGGGIDLRDARLQQVAELALGHRAERVQRQPGHLRLAHRVLEHERADLGAVAVRQHDLMAVAAQRHDGLGHRPRAVELVGPRAALVLLEQGVAADGDHDAHWFSVNSSHHEPQRARRVLCRVFPRVWPIGTEVDASRRPADGSACRRP